jgi:putative addiction module killer protein
MCSRMATLYTTVQYKTAAGKIPFKEWIDELRHTDQAAAEVVLGRLARVRCGNFGNCRFVGEGVWEFKIAYGPGYRIYYLLYEQNVVLLLCGGSKGEQHRGILAARKYAEDFRRRI